MLNTMEIIEEEQGPEGKRISLAFSWNGSSVPAVLLLPQDNDSAAAALLIHGFSLTKEHMAASVGRELLANGIASLALDLPLHGERCTNDFLSPGNPLELMDGWNAAQEECRLALEFLAAYPGVEKLTLVGYSLGAFMGLKVAADDPNIRAVVLAACGDLPEYMPFVPMVRMIADPIQWVRRLKQRPLLMLHGRQDTIVPAEQADRLFQAAGEPKKILWFDSGHILPQEAMARAAEWLRENTR